jgi:hypothetical protein
VSEMKQKTLDLQQFPLLACESYTTYVGGCPYLPFGD